MCWHQIKKYGHSLSGMKIADQILNNLIFENAISGHAHFTKVCRIINGDVKNLILKISDQYLLFSSFTKQSEITKKAGL